jgi:predicted kinase
MKVGKNLIILRGLPGSGKSTFAEVIGGTICCADDFMVDKDGNYFFDNKKLKYCHQKCFEKAKKAIEENKWNVVIANTNIQQWEWKKYESIAKENDYKIFHIIVENRHGSENVHGCPKDKVESKKEIFDICL